MSMLFVTSGRLAFVSVSILVSWRSLTMTEANQAHSMAMRREITERIGKSSKGKDVRVNVSAKMMPRRKSPA